MKSATIQETYCTTREAAQRLGVSLRTVQLWVESGVLKAWKTDGGHRRLPMSSVDELVQQRMGKGQAHSAASEVFSILVLEDEEDMVQLYQMTMETWSMPIQVTFVTSVYEALIAIGRGKPDLLITDLKMPGVDGFEIIKLLRNDEVLHNLDIVVVTGLNQAEIEERGSLPADVTVFTKPVSFDQLHGYIRACLTHRKTLERKNGD